MNFKQTYQQVNNYNQSNSISSPQDQQFVQHNQSIKYNRQQTNHKKNNFALCVIIICLVILFFVQYVIVQDNGYKTNLNCVNLQDCLQILNQQQKIIKLPYLKPQIFKPSQISQPELQTLRINNIQQLKQYSRNMGTSFQFSKKLYINWQDNIQQIFQVQYYRLNNKYNLDVLVTEKPICVLAPFKNLMKGGGDNGPWKMFMKSMNQQNYSNYKVYMMDDFSSDNSTIKLLEKVSQYPRLNNRIWIIKNKQRFGALGNRDSVTRNFCQPGSIIMDIDGDDAIIGKQVFNLFNRIYSFNKKAWYVYTNFLSIKGGQKGSGRPSKIVADQIKRGFCQNIRYDLLVNNIYRTVPWIWVTSQLRTYYRDLYMKIPLYHILQKDTNKYFIEASDRFTMYALAELAGLNHTFFYPQFSYFYYEPNYDALRNLECSLPILFKCQYEAHMMTPLKPLKSLEDKAEITQNYNIPFRIIFQYIVISLKQKICLKKLKQSSKNA